MVPADCTIIPWSAGTTCATTYMLCRHGTGQYHKCDHLYYVDVVLANHSKYGVVGWYHKCDHLYYVDVVPADHSKYVVGQYHMCGHLYYMDVVLANHSKYDVVGIGKTGPRAGGKQMYCSQEGVQMCERFTG